MSLMVVKDIVPKLDVEIRRAFGEALFDTGTVEEVKLASYEALRQITVRCKTCSRTFAYEPDLRRWRLVDPLFQESFDNRRGLYDIDWIRGKAHPTELRKRQFSLPLLKGPA